jgi:formylglycine-generating enzyme required for sulfatase activity
MNQVTADFNIDRTAQVVHTFTEDLGGGILLDMVLIPPGEFLMGSLSDEQGHESSESPQHLVKIDYPFFMSQYPITQAQWRRIAQHPELLLQQLNLNPSRFQGDNLPVEKVSWLDADKFCLWLSSLTRRYYHLPSETEWEYACRAGSTTPFHFGETIDAELANYLAKNEKIGDDVFPGKYGRGKLGVYRQQTTSVGSFGISNSFGLYDVHGNVWEWCEDHYHENYQEAPTDGSAWIDPVATESTPRILRGGSWFDRAMWCRSAARDWNRADNCFDSIGFRIVYSPTVTRI